MSDQRQAATDALRYVLDYVEREGKVNRNHAETCDAREDFRSADRYHSAAHALQKVSQKIKAFARERWHTDLRVDE